MRNDPEQRLIIFTRYPQAGRAKTRLIPALGPEQAAELYRQMAEHTLATVRCLRARSPIAIEVRFAGGDRDRMVSWLGADLSYREQAAGDLGDRLGQANQAAFEEGAGAVITIGTDCPELSAELLKTAFELLQEHDLVLGPATDGGYYLIGVRQFWPDLFQGIAWSTEQVLQQTLNIAARLGLTIAQLPSLTDVDRPEDLPIWEQRPSPYLSVIVPVLNEAATLATTLAPLQNQPGLEVIVVDGGSQDDTIDRARQQGVRVLSAAPGRAVQMNAGAAVARGEVLLFLHGDTQLPIGFDRWIKTTLAQPGVVAGAFQLAIAARLAGLRWVEWGVNLRSRWGQLPYGDQAIFLGRATFQQIGGFPELPIMEDVELVRRLKTLGKIAIVPASVSTSGRRWEKLGVWQTTLLNQWLMLAYRLGIPPQRIAKWYRRERKS